MELDDETLAALGYGAAFDLRDPELEHGIRVPTLRVMEHRRLLARERQKRFAAIRAERRDRFKRTLKARFGRCGVGRGRV